MIKFLLQHQEENLPDIRKLNNERFQIISIQEKRKTFYIKYKKTNQKQIRKTTSKEKVAQTTHEIVWELKKKKKRNIDHI